MREIKFRMLDRHRSAWIYYGTARQSIEPIMTEGFWYDELTEGQFTGLRDKHGVEIYEGDIVKMTAKNGGVAKAEVKFYTDDTLYNCGCCGCEFTASGFAAIANRFGNDLDGCEIVGNIHQNPELIP